MPPTRSHDSSYKRLFSHREMVADLIRAYVGASAAQVFDLGTLERCNGTYVSDDLRERHSDVVWKVRCRQGWIYVYLLLEFQSTVDRYMAVRMLAYVALLWQDLIRQGRLASKGLLPPVLPIVLYNGERRWTAATELRMLIAPVPELLAPFQPQARHLFLDELHLPITPGLALCNLAAALFAMERPSIAGHRAVLRGVGQRLARRPELERSIAAWYAGRLAGSGLLDPGLVGTISLDEVRRMLDTPILRYIRRRVARGEARGEARGRAQARATTSIALLLDLVRSGDFPARAARAKLRALAKAKTISAAQARHATAALDKLA